MPKMARPEETTGLIQGTRSGRSFDEAIEVSKCCVYTFFPMCFLILIILAAILKSYIEEWSVLTNANLTVVTSLVISAGAFGLVLSFVCWCEDKEKFFVAFVYTFVMTLQIAAVIYGCIQVADKNHTLKKTIEADMKDNFRTYSLDIKKAFDGLQMEKSCCGIYGAKDYTDLNRKMPISCCQITENMDTFCTDPSLAYKEGCASKMYNDIIYNLGILSYTTIGAVVLQIFLGISGLAIIMHNE